MDDESPKVTGSPDVIWLVYRGIEFDATHQECMGPGHEYVIWCEDQQYPSDVKYIRADSIAAITQERDEARAECSTIRTLEMKALLECERLRADAARYDFLRQDFSPMGLNIDGNHAWTYRRNATLQGPNLDAAIDAARKRE